MSKIAKLDDLVFQTVTELNKEIYALLNEYVDVLKSGTLDELTELDKLIDLKQKQVNELIDRM